MLYDRPYMRESSGRRENAVLTWLIVTIVAAFAVQQIISIREPGADFIQKYFAATSLWLSHGYIWTLFTYGFLHGDIIHILLNLLGLYLFGRIVLPLMGPARFVAFFFAAMAIGGGVWYGVEILAHLNYAVIGVSAVCMGLFAVFATLFPEQPISFLFIPITVKPKHAAWATAGISLFCMAVFEIPGRSPIAHSAHLGGMLAGWLYGRFIHHRTGTFGLRPAIELPAWMRRKKRAAATASPSYTVNVTPSPTDLRAEVDRILDKINSQGFGSLTDEERRVLDEARDVLNKR